MQFKPNSVFIPPFTSVFAEEGAGYCTSLLMAQNLAPMIYSRNLHYQDKIHPPDIRQLLSWFYKGDILLCPGKSSAISFQLTANIYWY